MARSRKAGESRGVGSSRSLTLPIAGTIAAGLAVLVLAFLLIRDEPRQTPKPGQIGVAASEAGCKPEEHPKNLGRQRLTRADHPPYSSNPPTSGYYFEAGIDPAFYGEPPPVEQLVKSLADGQVVIWYTGIPVAEKNQLRAVLTVLKKEITAVPGEKIGVKEPVVMTAWGVLQRCRQVSGEAIERFVAAHYQGSDAIRPSPSGG